MMIQLRYYAVSHKSMHFTNIDTTNIIDATLFSIECGSHAHKHVHSFVVVKFHYCV